MQHPGPGRRGAPPARAPTLRAPPQVGAVQRNLIGRLLTNTTLHKHMAAARETHGLLRCALDFRDRPRPPEPSDGGSSIRVRAPAAAIP